ncbi:C-type lectin domain family 12 member B-like [Ctenodactylus gundi]
MSDEVTYTTLTFQYLSGARNKQDRNDLREQGCSAPSPAWRPAALGLLALCLMLLAGLVALGVMVFQMSSGMNSDSEKLTECQKTIHLQQDNSSQQLSNSKDTPTAEEFLKSQVANLSKRQEQMAVRLCKELLVRTAVWCKDSGSQVPLSSEMIFEEIEKQVSGDPRAIAFVVLLGVISFSDHKCNPCPQMWQWHQDSCYYFIINEENTWSDSRNDCRAKNATLMKIDTLEEKNFLKSQPLLTSSFFWLGLSWDRSGASWRWEDGSVSSPSFAEISWICEKSAAPVKIETLS